MNRNLWPNWAIWLLFLLGFVTIFAGGTTLALKILLEKRGFPWPGYSPKPVILAGASCVVLTFIAWLIMKIRSLPMTRRTAES